MQIKVGERPNECQQSDFKSWSDSEIDLTDRKLIQKNLQFIRVVLLCIVHPKMVFLNLKCFLTI